MLIKEQRGKRCPLGYGHNVGYVSCEECDHWMHRLYNPSDKPIDSHKARYVDEYCKLLKEAV